MKKGGPRERRGHHPAAIQVSVQPETQLQASDWKRRNLQMLGADAIVPERLTPEQAAARRAAKGKFSSPSWTGFWM